MRKSIFVLVIILSIFTQIQFGYSQHRFETIQSDYLSGQLTYEQYLVNNVLSIYAPEKLPESYQRIESVTPIRSGTFIIHEAMTHWNELSPESQNILSSYLYRPDLKNHYLSPTGRFRIHYDTDGYDQVDTTDADFSGIPDYVEFTANYFDHVHTVIVNDLGYNPPLADSSGNATAYNVYLVNISGAYGNTYLLPMPGTDSKYYTYMELENDFRGFQTEPYDAIAVTAAHEYFHAVQVGYKYRDEDVFFMEMCSVWMEDFIYDYVNDYLLYLPSFYNTPNLPFIYDGGNFMYAQGIWNHMITKKYGTGVFTKVWNLIPQKNALSSIRSVLPDYDTDFNTELASFGLWNLFTKHRADTINYYPEGQLYPEIKFSEKLSLNTNTLDIEADMRKMSSVFYQVVDPSNNDSILICLTNFEEPDDNYLLNDRSDFGLGFVRITSDLIKDDPNFFIKNNLSQISDYVGAELKIDHQGDWFARAVTWKEDGSYKVYQLFPPFDVSDRENKNFIENIYPSPYIIADGNPMVITYVVTDEEMSELAIFTSSGRLVKKEEFGIPTLNYRLFEWDGRNDDGDFVGSGVYIAVLRVGNDTDIKKFAVVNK